MVSSCFKGQKMEFAKKDSNTIQSRITTTIIEFVNEAIKQNGLPSSKKLSLTSYPPNLIEHLLIKINKISFLTKPIDECELKKRWKEITENIHATIKELKIQLTTDSYNVNSSSNGSRTFHNCNWKLAAEHLIRAKYNVSSDINWNPLLKLIWTMVSDRQRSRLHRQHRQNIAHSNSVTDLDGTDVYSTKVKTFDENEKSSMGDYVQDKVQDNVTSVAKEKSIGLRQIPSTGDLPSPWGDVYEFDDDDFDDVTNKETYEENIAQNGIEYIKDFNHFILQKLNQHFVHTTPTRVTRADIIKTATAAITNKTLNISSIQGLSHMTIELISTCLDNLNKEEKNKITTMTKIHDMLLQRQ